MLTHWQKALRPRSTATPGCGFLAASELQEAIYANPTQPGVAVPHTTVRAEFPALGVHVYTGSTNMAARNQEVEIKLAIDDIAALRGKLRTMRAQAAPRVFECGERAMCTSRRRASGRAATAEACT